MSTKHSIKLLVSIFLLLELSITAFGQKDSCLTILLLKKGHSLQVRNDMVSVNDNGFHLYRNCIYDIELKTKQRYTARLIDIKNDSLYFTNFLNANVAKQQHKIFDTLKLGISDISRFFFIADRMIDLHSEILLSNYDITFSRDTLNCALEVRRQPIYFEDTTKYELVPYLTAQGLNSLYERDGYTYYYVGPMPKPEPRFIDTVFRKRTVWVIPFGNVDVINGFALSLLTMPCSSKDSLKVRGVCFEMGAGAFAIPYGSFMVKDSVFYSGEPDPTTVRIKGVCLSFLGSLGETEISGFYATFGVTHVNKLKGLSITGINTMTNEFRGVCISGLRNQAKKGRGIQIGLWNSCKDLRGIQFGLWNKNGRRSLPFINWQFRSKPKVRFSDTNFF
jgi:hypothetical protein